MTQSLNLDEYNLLKINYNPLLFHICTKKSSLHGNSISYSFYRLYVAS
jgi:hypothetical protein